MKKPALVSVLLVIALLLGLSSSAAAETLRLRNGALLVGKIENPDENGFVFLRIRDGGRIHLRWEDLILRDAERLRASFQLLGQSDGDVVSFRAFRVWRKTSGAPKALTGELLGRDGQKIRLRILGNTIELPLMSLTGTPQFVDVPIREILTPDEIYRRKLGEMNPGEDADKHVLLADYLIRVEEFQRAKEHLQEAQRLGSGSQPNKIIGLLERVESMLANKAEADHLREISVAANRNKFPKALQLMASFEEKYPSSKLASEFSRRKALVMKARERYLIDKVTEDWYRYARDEAKKLARSRDLGVEQVQVKAAEDMGQAIRERIARMRKIEVPEVEALFRRRFEFPLVPKIQPATYGQGSWILGEKDLIAGTARGKLAEKAESNTITLGNQVRRERERRLREFIRSQGRRAGQNPQQAAQRLDSPSDWWQEASTRERQLFILASYAERSGDMKVERAQLRPCMTCAASGRVQVPTAEAGRMVSVTCPTCHGLKHFRTIRFR
ncbi:MAG: hypothetical protein CSA62_11020 [Planctomycetota bacterium]|nr:MAG: hypothetical protein CSA62_11020 [Planctomycetota bacterium]